MGACENAEVHSAAIITCLGLLKLSTISFGGIQCPLGVISGAVLLRRTGQASYPGSDDSWGAGCWGSPREQPAAVSLVNCCMHAILHRCAQVLVMPLGSHQQAHRNCCFKGSWTIAGHCHERLQHGEQRTYEAISAVLCVVFESQAERKL